MERLPSGVASRMCNSRVSRAGAIVMTVAEQCGELGLVLLLAVLMRVAPDQEEETLSNGEEGSTAQINECLLA